MEGVVPWMYLDILGLVTTAIGNLIDPRQYAMKLPWRRRDGGLATPAEIITEWERVKNTPALAKWGHRAAEQVTSLRLDPEGIEQVVFGKLHEMNGRLAARFPQFEDWPADAQLATLSMSWACGPAFRFPRLEAALRDYDFATAAEHCHINEAGNPGLVPRNRANKMLYRNAARSHAFHLDPDALVWPTDLASLEQDDVPTQPEALSPASQPTIHVDPSAYLRAEEWLDKDPDDDPPPAAA